ncbi:hemolysin family protein [Tengunoibacter tsumagoiensis]|uniref:Membrane protein n=1 Tax=Tengunoibacter tsumagoiensis TaxID=2014871 RepID=A0A401ZX93_9CHLR|nr:hemolysin family protein [Tengunoibacter tsumagoiensis]GCE11462.1 membrane protein [Tengunoibacter tsumagoiensis]
MEDTVDLNALLGLGAVVLLVAANGFFVASEFALVKIRSTRIDQLVAEGNQRAKTVQMQIHHLDTYIAATQLGITLASLALGWVGEPALAHLIEPLFAWIGGPTAATLSHTLAVIISFSLITAFHIIMGELVPKSIALQLSEETALFVARPLLIFARVFRPFIHLMNSIGNGVVRLLGLHVNSEHTAVHSVEELEMLVAQSRQGGILDAGEEALLYHVFDFGDKTVQQVMLPRTEIVGVPVTIQSQELQALFAREQYTRLPVYEKTLDSIIGMVHLKDVFSWLQNHSPSDLFDLRSLLRPLLYVTEVTTIEATLTQMRNKRIHLAIIIDEYGATAGMVTMEDIVEELVGEVQDEFDTQERGVRPEVEHSPDGSCSVDGLMSLDAFREQFGLQSDHSHANTLGGYIFEQLDRLPQVGDTIQANSYVLRVEEMDIRRIARVHVSHLPQASTQDDPLSSTPFSE